MASGYQRIIEHYQSDAATLVGGIDPNAVVGCWFELHRHGGCGAGELRLRDGFPDRNSIDVGDWISLSYSTGQRWYFGRVESREADSPAGLRFRLEGMSIELGEVFPGGFGVSADGVPPHRYANTDLFQYDPDYLLETFDSIATTAQLVKALMNQYVLPATHISLDPLDIEEAPDEAGLASFKFRGEESMRSILKDVSLRANNASWGVDETGAFFFIQPRLTVAATFREGTDISRLEESRDRDLLFNRVLLTGGYVYNEPLNSENSIRGFHRWRAHYLQPRSRDEHGERRIRLWVPWIRTESDSRGFIREFFRTYSQPTSRFLIDVPNQSTLLKPWEGRVQLLDRNGSNLITAPIETLRVEFDQAPLFRMEIGPADPHTLWPEPPHDERWEIKNEGGGDVTLTTETESTSSAVTSLTSLTSLTSEGSTLSSMSDASSPESGSLMPSGSEESGTSQLSSALESSSEQQTSSSGLSSEVTSGSDSGGSNSGGGSSEPISGLSSDSNSDSFPLESSSLS
jgi:hypothetical protein